MCVTFCGCCEKDWGAEGVDLPQEELRVCQAVRAEVSAAHLLATWPWNHGELFNLSLLSLSLCLRELMIVPASQSCYEY